MITLNRLKIRGKSEDLILTTQGHSTNRIERFHLIISHSVDIYEPIAIIYVYNVLYTRTQVYFLILHSVFSDESCTKILNESG